MTKHNVTITTGPGQPRFEIDGHDIAGGIYGASISIGRGGATRIEVEIAVSMIDVSHLGSPDAEVMVSLPSGAKEALVALGWIPPTMAATPRDAS